MRVDTALPVAALTLDDGPDDEQTERILGVLARRGATASFFVLADRAVRRPDLLRAIRDGGHELALHGDDHSSFIGRSIRASLARIGAAKRRLERLAGVRIRHFRPPYGWQDVRSFVAARAAGLRVVGWTSHGRDWVEGTPGEIAARATASLAPGDILLLHERREPVPGDVVGSPFDLDRAAVVDEVLERAAAIPIRFVALPSLLDVGRARREAWFWRPVEPTTPPRGTARS
jgi:peptidoglycan/xylan/chitin deacetylase (PgdA/CDA1 family)